MTAVKYRSEGVDGVRVFYREAGGADAPALLLLHGFPSASHMFRDLIPLLADHLHIIAPDLPGFGQSDMPLRRKFPYTFDDIASVIDRFTEVVGLKHFAIYVFDYGAPTGFRLAVKHPDRITAIISQNGNAYEEGLSEGWDPIRAYWKNPSQGCRQERKTDHGPARNKQGAFVHRGPEGGTPRRSSPKREPFRDKRRWSWPDSNNLRQPVDPCLTFGPNSRHPGIVLRGMADGSKLHCIEYCLLLAKHRAGSLEATKPFGGHNSFHPLARHRSSSPESSLTAPSEVALGSFGAARFSFSSGTS